MIRKPNFFIVGAPKCGTTALATYLSEHPQVYFSKPKEIHYFSTDFYDFGFKGTVNDYLANYFSKSINKQHLRIGEGSTWYLYSEKALENIFKFNKESKIIVMIRKPSDMVYSLHSQLLFSGFENISDFYEAWNMQDKRRGGYNIPKWCKEKKFLLYGDIAKYSFQLERVYK
ncbi:MAG: sulfotransferase, partial [Candidatus Omnitrophica bacterium]|nr:sulfotransferase [Candidatus Omnitrophota bacterium]